MHETERVVKQFHESWDMRDPERGMRVISDDCDFEDVNIGKADAWFAGNFMSKWQFRDCNIQGALLGKWLHHQCDE